MKGLQFVVRVNCFQWFHKRSGAGRGITVRHAVDASAVIGFDRNDEPIVANGYQFILDRFA